MRFTVFEFAGKEQHLRKALLEAGHEEAQARDGALTTDFDLLLVDCDWPWAYPRPLLIAAAKQMGAMVVQYPHSGRPTCWVYDGIAEPNDLVDMRLEHGSGNLAIAELAGHDLRQEPCGWLFSETGDFQPVEKPRKVLFAPLHVNLERLMRGSNGHDPAPTTNQPVYRRLLELRNIELTVSVSGPVWCTGVWPHPRARIVENPNMRFEQSLALIDEADVVVAAGTMAATAVARGKPTIMLDQGTFSDYVDGDYVPATHERELAALVRYPIDVDDGHMGDLIRIACEVEQTPWRDRWVGEDGADRAVSLIEGVVRPEEAVKRDVTIQGVTARAITRS